MKIKNIFYFENYYWLTLTKNNFILMFITQYFAHNKSSSIM